MSKGWYWRLFLVLSSIVLAVIYLVPTIVGVEPKDPNKPNGQLVSKLPDWWPAREKRVSLGLDLQGGMYLILSVDTDKAVVDRAERLAVAIREHLEDEGIDIASAVLMDEESRNIAIQVESPEDLQAAEEEVTDYYRSQVVIVSAALPADQADDTFVVNFKPEYVDHIKEYAVNQAITTLRNRIDEFNVREPEIIKQGENNILIQLPGLKDPERALKLIGRTAQLEFRIVDDESDIIKKMKGTLPKGIRMERHTYRGPKNKLLSEYYLVSEDKGLLEKFLKGKIPRTHEIAFGQRPSEKTPGKSEWKTYLLKSRTETTYMTGDTLTDAVVRLDPQKNEPYVSLTFDAQGAGEFERITGANVKRRMAIVLDGVVNSAPVIQTKIGGGRAQITLNALKSYNALLQEAKDLALVLRSGALPAPVSIEQNRTVGPSLGKESIQKGKISLIVGGLLVVLFMIIYYKFTGIIDVIALSLNVVFIFAVLAGFEATLTLPGLAGIVLTIGMAVDANVIINERIREEIRAGKTSRTAIDGGYGKALWTILDANITTIIAGVVLLQYGSGPIRGFAVTLIIGIVSSMFTAIICTRLIMDLLTIKFRISRISI
ncbi:MAG: protein translocase subunit SecD [Deltaproteobacteria bacterium]|nr:protein translocase subunit SecD [Deltaproteobacteria bacterium]